jgi:hypothetical protein
VRDKEGEEPSDLWHVNTTSSFQGFGGSDHDFAPRLSFSPLLMLFLVARPLANRVSLPLANRVSDQFRCIVSATTARWMGHPVC